MSKTKDNVDHAGLSLPFQLLSLITLWSLVHFFLFQNNNSLIVTKKWMVVLVVNKLLHSNILRKLVQSLNLHILTVRKMASVNQNCMNKK